MFLAFWIGLYSTEQIVSFQIAHDKNLVTDWVADMFFSTFYTKILVLLRM